jgi:hypothetical protein
VNFDLYNSYPKNIFVYHGAKNQTSVEYLRDKELMFINDQLEYGSIFASTYLMQIVALAIFNVLYLFIVQI